MATAQPTSVPSAQTLQQQYTPPNSQGQSQAQQFAQRSSPSTSTSGNATPTTHSPTSIQNAAALSQVPLAQRQIRPPKSPMYIPAALRPTDRPQRAHPLTPPRSLHGSTDSLNNSADPRPASRRSTDPGKRKQALDRVSETSSNEEIGNNDQTEPVDDFGDLIALTGNPPTRQHWKADAYASICDGPTCQKRFGLFERRHHCRHCGDIFCKEHSSLQLPLDQNADFHPQGAMVRSCGNCYDRYDEWLEARRHIKRGSIVNHGSLGPNSPVRLIGGKAPKSPDAHKGSVAGSVTRDWNWSTF